MTDSVRLLWRTDVHVSDRGPISRTDDWMEACCGKLRQVGNLAEKLGAHAVIDGGDFFHIKSPSRNSHKLVATIAALHAKYPCPVYANVGNHDCVYGDYTFLGQQPLGVLYDTGVFQRLYDRHEAVFRVGDIQVRVVGIPYHGTTYDMERFTTAAAARQPEDTHLVVVAHVLASQKGGKMFEGEDIIKYEDLAKLDGVSCWAFGHWHKDQGIITLSNGATVVNVGSLTRGSLSQDNLSRHPCAVEIVFNADGVTTQRHPLVVPDIDACFDMQTRQEGIDREEAVDGFVRSLRGTLVDTTEGTLLEKVRGLMIDPKIKERAIWYLENTASQGRG